MTLQKLLKTRKYKEKFIKLMIAKSKTEVLMGKKLKPAQSKFFFTGFYTSKLLRWIFPKSSYCGKIFRLQKGITRKQNFLTNRLKKNGKPGFE